MKLYLTRFLILLFVVISASCTKEIITDDIIIDDITLSDITISKMSYVECDSVLFTDTAGNQIVGYIHRTDFKDESVNHEEFCNRDGQTRNEPLMYHFSWQSVAVFINFPDLGVNFNLRYWSNYYSCCSGEQFDDLVVSRNYPGSKDRFDVLRIITDEKSLSKEIVESGFAHYDCGLKDIFCQGKSYTKVFQGRLNRETPIHFYFTFQDEIVSFLDNDGKEWNLKN